MKLECKVRINDRQRTHGSSTLKSAKGVIGLAKSNADEWALIVRLFKDTSATQYKVTSTPQIAIELNFCNPLAPLCSL